MFGGVLGDFTQVCFDNVVAVEEGHFTVGLDPDLNECEGSGGEVSWALERGSYF